MSESNNTAEKHAKELRDIVPVTEIRTTMSRAWAAALFIESQAKRIAELERDNGKIVSERNFEQQRSDKLAADLFAIKLEFRKAGYVGDDLVAGVANLRALFDVARSHEPDTRLIKAAKALVDAMPSGQGLRSFHAGRQVVDLRDAIEAVQRAPETRERQPMKMRIDRETLRKQIASDPDVPVEAGLMEVTHIQGVVCPAHGPYPRAACPICINEASAAMRDAETKQCDPPCPVHLCGELSKQGMCRLSETTAPHPILDRKVTVCASCLRACCWQGQFMCDESDMAGTVEKTVRELRDKAHGENAEYWFKDPATGKIDRKAQNEYKALERG